MNSSKEARLKRLDNVTDEMIVYDEDSPGTDRAFWAEATVVLPANKSVKELKSMRFDPDLYEWYRERACALNIPMQSLMHSVLESYRNYEDNHNK